MAFENKVISWLMNDGWEVYQPVVDNGHKTDILISDGESYHRIQIKTVEVADESQLIRNKWGESKVDVVVCFARNSNFGYLFAPFKGATELLNAKTHLRFNQNKNSFLKAFHKL
jgi:hypothetical protein